MAKSHRKSPAAVALGKKRWKNVSSEERSRRMRELIKRRWAKAKRRAGS